MDQFVRGTAGERVSQIVRLESESGASSPPACPTPDYFSDTSLNDQSFHTSQTVKSSILKFEEKNKAHPGNGLVKTVTFGQNTTQEFTPLKNLHRAGAHDRVEMQSIDSFDLTDPKQVAPKPPPVYFRPPSATSSTPACSAGQRTTVVEISEYPTGRAREPARFDFLQRDAHDGGFDRELASTLSRSNLKKKTEASSECGFDAPPRTEPSKPIEGTRSRRNGFHSTPVPVAPVTEMQISNVKKALKTFERTPSNTVLLKIPKIN